MSRITRIDTVHIYFADWVNFEHKIFLIDWLKN